MSERDGIFAGEDPIKIVRSWLKEAEASEVNDPIAAAMATVDASGMPNVRIVLIKEIEDDAFVFYTNYGSAKGRELTESGKAAFVFHWKSLRRQIRVRGHVTREDGPQADAYFASRPRDSRIGAWASRQSEPLASREALMERVAEMGADKEDIRPEFWGGFRIVPTEMEFWADGSFRLHDRFRWVREQSGAPWHVSRLNP